MCQMNWQDEMLAPGFHPETTPRPIKTASGIVMEGVVAIVLDTTNRVRSEQTATFSNRRTVGNCC